MKLMMLVGLPASGKSTWVNEYMKDHPETVIISSDNNVEQLCENAGISYSEGFKTHIKEATKMMNDQVDDAIKNCKNVIWDQTNITVKTRAGKMNKFMNYELFAVYFPVSEVEQRIRLDDRHQKTGKFIPSYVIDSVRSNLEVPTIDEGFDEVIHV